MPINEMREHAPFKYTKQWGKAFENPSNIPVVKENDQKNARITLKSLKLQNDKNDRIFLDTSNGPP